MNITSLFEEFRNKKVLIIGDLMLDTYVRGSVERISPEAPVPVVLVKSRDYCLGGAGNVAANIISLGALPYLVSITGTDEGGKKMTELMQRENMDTTYIFQHPDIKSTVKTRVIGNKIQMLRIDEESNEPLNDEPKHQFLALLRRALDEISPDVVIFEDYDKGCIQTDVIKLTLEYTQKNGIPVAVDPKKNNFFNYSGVHLFKPNLKELNDATGLLLKPEQLEILKNGIFEFRNKMPHHITLLTLSEFGIISMMENSEFYEKAHLRNISDVSGAGDSVISVAALCLACKTDLKTLTQLSNLAGGIVCEYSGVVPVNKERLMQEAAKTITLPDF